MNLEHISLYFPQHPNVSLSEHHILFYSFICSFNLKTLNPIHTANKNMVVESSIVAWKSISGHTPKIVTFIPAAAIN